MKRKRKLTIAMATGVLAVLGGTAVENGLLEMVDPDTWAVVFRCRPQLLS